MSRNRTLREKIAGKIAGKFAAGRCKADGNPRCKYWSMYNSHVNERGGKKIQKKSDLFEKPPNTHTHGRSSDKP